MVNLDARTPVGCKCGAGTADVFCTAIPGRCVHQPAEPLRALRRALRGEPKQSQMRQRRGERCVRSSINSERQMRVHPLRDAIASSPRVLCAAVGRCQWREVRSPRTLKCMWQRERERARENPPKWETHRHVRIARVVRHSHTSRVRDVGNPAVDAKPCAAPNRHRDKKKKKE